MSTPIASKSFGIDVESGLEKQLLVWGQFSDAKNEKITIYFDIVLVSPTGTVFSIIKSGNYTRSGTKFQTLRASQLGQGITALITTDLDMIQDFETLDQDLMQITP